MHFSVEELKKLQNDTEYQVFLEKHDSYVQFQNLKSEIVQTNAKQAKHNTEMNRTMELEMEQHSRLKSRVTGLIKRSKDQTSDVSLECIEELKQATAIFHHSLQSESDNLLVMFQQRKISIDEFATKYNENRLKYHKAVFAREKLLTLLQ